MRVADTSALYPLFDADDAHHEQARNDLANPTPVLIPSEILVETVNLLHYRFGWSPAHSALEALLSKPHTNLAQPVPMAGVQDTYKKAQGDLSLADATVVQTCRVHGATPLSYDEAILKRVE